MKRDMDLVRDILLAVEERGQDPMDTVRLALEGRSQAEISYHVMLLDEAGLLEAIDFSSMEGQLWRPKRLTWAGHEFLDSVRDPDIWKRTKEGAQKVGGFGLDVLGALARGLVRQKVKEHTGIELDL